MNQETWLDANEAKDLGFIDYITEPVKVAAKYDISNFKNITNDKIKSIINQNQNKMAKTENGLLEDIKALFVKNESIKNADNTVETKAAEEGEDMLEETPEWYKRTYEELKDRVDALEAKVDKMSAAAEKDMENMESMKAELTD